MIKPLNVRTIVYFCALMLSLSAGPLGAAERVALVIGNSAYENTIVLPNPQNDAADMAAALRRLDFEVIEGIDLDQHGMKTVMRAFSRALAGAEVALFFYAGHGLQIAGKNYLAPVDAKLQDEADLDFETVELNLVLRQMEREQRTSIVFLDACRDNPLARDLARSMGAARSSAVGRGLASVESGLGTLISYATQPGNVAQDGTGRNSPFTAALLEHIDRPGVTISQTLIAVRNDVVAATNRKQVPWDHSSLTGDFYFRPAADSAEVAALPPEPADAPASSDREALFWDSIKNSTDWRDFEAYLDRFGEAGTFGDLAVIRRDRFKQGSPSESRAAPTPDRDDGPANELQRLEADLSRSGKSDIQEALGTIGHYGGAIDGLFGAGTRRAIKSYQTASGVPATGYLTDEQRRVLTSAARVKSTELAAAKPAAAPKPAPETPKPKQEAAKPAQTAAATPAGGETAGAAEPAPSRTAAVPKPASSDVLRSAKDALVEARALVRELSDLARQVKGMKPATLAANLKKFRGLLGKVVDFEPMAKFVLGPHLDRISSTQWEDFLLQYKELFLSGYEFTLADAWAGTYEIEGVREYGRDYLLTVLLNRKSGSPMRVGFRIRYNPNSRFRFKIIDAMTKGVSLLVTQKSDFSGILASKGVDGLVDELARKFGRAVKPVEIPG